MTAGVSNRAGGSLDPRRNAFRSDLAAEALQGIVEAGRYASGEPAVVARAAAPLRKSPDLSHGFETEALFGEPVTVFDQAGGWSWVQLTRDGYVGYMPSDALRRGILHPTHRVQTLGTFVYGAPDIKSAPLMHLSMNALLPVRGGNERFLELDGGGFVYTRHAMTLERHARDFVEVAERFLATPYLWGGRTHIGIDCSGLVQTSLLAAGFAVPRDTDMQQSELGQSVPIANDFDGLTRGDLVFWKGHVGIMIDGVLMVHANGHHMLVVIEPLPEAAERMRKLAGDVVAVKRMESVSAR